MRPTSFGPSITESRTRGDEHESLSSMGAAYKYIPDTQEDVHPHRSWQASSGVDAILPRSRGSMAPPTSRPSKGSGDAHFSGLQGSMAPPSLRQSSKMVADQSVDSWHASSRTHSQPLERQLPTPSSSRIFRDPQALQSREPVRQSPLASTELATTQRSRSQPVEGEVVNSIETDEAVAIKSPRSSSVAEQLRGNGRARTSAPVSDDGAIMRQLPIGILKPSEAGTNVWHGEDEMSPDLIHFLEDAFYSEINTIDRVKWWNAMKQPDIVSHLDGSCVLGSVIGRSYTQNSAWVRWGRACSTCVRKKRPCVLLLNNGQTIGFLPTCDAIEKGVPWDDGERYITK